MCKCVPSEVCLKGNVTSEITGHDDDDSKDSKIQSFYFNKHVTPEPEPEIKTMSQNIITAKSSKTKNKSFPNASKNTSNINMLPQSSSVSVSPMMKMCSNITVDKDVTASSSNIDLFNLIHSSDDLAELSADTTETCESAPKRLTRQLARETTPIWRDKHPRQHRIKVRSPKRRTIVIDSQNKSNERSMDMKVNLKNHDTNEKKIVDKIMISKDNKSSHCNYIDDKIVVNIATEPIDWKREVEVCATNLMIEAEEDERQSDHSLEDMCRICHGGDSLCQELGQLISACSCRGTVGRVHVKCLERWLTESGKSRCELCGTRYMTRRVHRYGVPRALVMWVLSQNAKQLMVDSLGIMLMSPLAVLAAWLSGRTLAGLMTQDSHATPWPLASTFVLACMTLVCYYCWIVSAATRHALGWWIWYRSQYEVRLQLQNGEE